MNLLFAVNTNTNVNAYANAYANANANANANHHQEQEQEASFSLVEWYNNTIVSQLDQLCACVSAVHEDVMEAPTSITPSSTSTTTPPSPCFFPGGEESSVFANLHPHGDERPVRTRICGVEESKDELDEQEEEAMDDSVRCQEGGRAATPSSSKRSPPIRFDALGTFGTPTTAIAGMDESILTAASLHQKETMPMTNVGNGSHADYDDDDSDMWTFPPVTPTTTSHTTTTTITSTGTWVFPSLRPRPLAFESSAMEFCVPSRPVADSSDHRHSPNRLLLHTTYDIAEGDSEAEYDHLSTTSAKDKGDIITANGCDTTTTHGGPQASQSKQPPQPRSSPPLKRDPPYYFTNVDCYSVHQRNHPGTAPISPADTYTTVSMSQSLLEDQEGLEYDYSQEFDQDDDDDDDAQSTISTGQTKDCCRKNNSSSLHNNNKYDTPPRQRELDMDRDDSEYRYLLRMTSQNYIRDPDADTTSTSTRSDGEEELPFIPTHPIHYGLMYEATGLLYQATTYENSSKGLEMEMEESAYDSNDYSNLPIMPQLH